MCHSPSRFDDRPWPVFTVRENLNERVAVLIEAHPEWIEQRAGDPDGLFWGARQELHGSKG
jgi:hypothetical protein